MNIIGNSHLALHILSHPAAALWSSGGAFSVKHNPTLSLTLITRDRRARTLGSSMSDYHEAHSFKKLAQNFLHDLSECGGMRQT